MKKNFFLIWISLAFVGCSHVASKESSARIPASEAQSDLAFHCKLVNVGLYGPKGTVFADAFSNGESLSVGRSKAMVVYASKIERDPKPTDGPDLPDLKVIQIFEVTTDQDGGPMIQTKIPTNVMTTQQAAAYLYDLNNQVIFSCSK